MADMDENRAMPDSSQIRPAQPSDRAALIEMRVALWPESSAEEQGAEVDAWLGRGTPGFAARRNSDRGEF